MQKNLRVNKLIQENVVYGKIKDLFFNRDTLGLNDLWNEMDSAKNTKDREISDFLNNQHRYAMSFEEVDTPLWKQYKEMLQEWETIVKMKNISSYYMRELNVQ